jgi:beta-N-acetylhexosaminidase
MYTDMANSYTKIPVIIVTDVEFGPGENMADLPVITNAMAWGACDDPELIETAAELTAKICRLHGLHWTLSPVVDLNINFNNPLVNIRSATDDPKHMVKIMGAFLRGIQKNGYMAATLKHFPGDGVDDRNQHFCTTVNSLSMDKWQDSFGYVYREMIKMGVASVMCAHIGLPSYANEKTEIGPVPAVLSKPLLTDLLKGDLGFEGCVISDAMSMVGSAACVSLDELALTFIKNGGDMVLFNEPQDSDLLLAALEENRLSRERLMEAVKRVYEIKRKARIFEDEEEIAREIGETQEELIEKLRAVSQKIADKSIKFVRNFNNILPIYPKKDAKFLSIEIKDDPNTDSSVISKELKARGYEVDVTYGMKHRELADIMNDYDYLLISFFFTGSHGGTMRIGWKDIATFWRAYVLQHPNVIFVSFGDPYKLYDFPFLKTYVNAFSYTEASQRALVKTILGEVGERAKNPVSLEGFFERETNQNMMKVATYNIASGQTFEDFAKTGESTFDLMKTAAFIKGFGADVITLNEIASQYTTNAGRINEVEQIAQHCEYESSEFAQGTIFPPTRDLGNAILSNYPILESKAIRVLAPTEEERRPDENSWYEDRVILCCILEAFGTKIRYITTHFGLNKQEKERMMSALCDLLNESDMPTVLSGDFNELPHSDILQPIYEKYRSAADVMGVNDCTLCESMEPPLTVDHIFVSDHFEVLEYRVLKRVVSDHYPCLAKLRLK